MTKETVAGERPRCSANFLRLTGRLAVRAEETGLLPSVDGGDLRVATVRSLAQRKQWSKPVCHRRLCGASLT